MSVQKFVLTNQHGMEVHLISLGATIQRILIPCNGNKDDVVLGFNDVARYQDSGYYGVTVGRVANRIAGGSFELDGILYKLYQNNGINCLHGGELGLSKRLWEGTVINEREVMMKYVSADGEDGFPGTLDVVVTFTLSNDNEVVIRYQATTDKRTPVNLTNHSFFNLDLGNSLITEHTVQVNADLYIPVNESLIPTGEIASVTGTPFDLRSEVRIANAFSKLPNELKGIDHTFVIQRKSADSGALALAAVVRSESKQRTLRCYTTQPGVQLYTGNYLNGVKGYNGIKYERYSGLCLETQAFPDSVNQKTFPSIILDPKDIYDHTTVYCFEF
eukprot:Rmarinus@m.20666